MLIIVFFYALYSIQFSIFEIFCPCSLLVRKKQKLICLRDMEIPIIGFPLQTNVGTTIVRHISSHFLAGLFFFWLERKVKPRIIIFSLIPSYYKMNTKLLSY